MTQINGVRTFGESLRVFVDSADSEAVVGLGTASTSCIHTVSIEFSNGYSVVIGQQEGGPNEPMACWLEKDGEPVEGGRMSWSEQFTFNIPS